jgi:hypothetical protein
MAIKLIATYSKRLGLPGFSSHQFGVEIEAELSNIDDVPREAARIYELLQVNVDQQIRATGFVPPTDYGLVSESRNPVPSTTTQRGRSNRQANWKCTPKQRELIEDLVAEHQIEKGDVEALSSQRFGKGVISLNKTEASLLIDELFATYGRGPSHKPQPQSQRRRAA